MRAAVRVLPAGGTLERVKLDAFYGGVCCALATAFYGADAGTETYYLEVVGSVGAEDLLNYARRENDPELPRIRAAVKWISDREARARKYPETASESPEFPAQTPAISGVELGASEAES